METDTIRLGEPVQIATLRADAPAMLQTNQSVPDLVGEARGWFFPVLVNGKMRIMLLVDKHGGQWTAVSLGFPRLAREWEKVTRRWPEHAGFHPRVIASYSANRWFFWVPEVNAANLTPIHFPTEPSVGWLGVAPEPDPDSYERLGSAETELGKLKPGAHAEAPTPSR
jgi:hypothetical protein